MTCLRHFRLWPSARVKRSGMSRSALTKRDVAKNLFYRSGLSWHQWFCSCFAFVSETGIDLHTEDGVYYTFVYIHRSQRSKALERQRDMEPRPVPASVASPSESGTHVNASSQAKSSEPSVCPCCGSSCIEVRSLWHCPRCRHSFCEACEGGAS